MKDAAERQAKIEAMRDVGDKIAALDKEVGRGGEGELKRIASTLPNIPDPRTPYGKDDSENVVMRPSASRANSTSHPSRTGTSARLWASSTSSAAPS